MKVFVDNELFSYNHSSASALATAIQSLLVAELKCIVLSYDEEGLPQAHLFSNIPDTIKEAINVKG